MGQQIKPGLRFFGHAIDGDINLEEDGRPDIVIGSQGMAVVFRYRYCVYMQNKQEILTQTVVWSDHN